MQGFATLSKAARNSGPLGGQGSWGSRKLGVKEKEYIALAISIALRCEPCILFHVEALVRAGASREELGDVPAMSVQMRGGPSVMHAGQARGARNELTAATR